MPTTCRHITDRPCRCLLIPLAIHVHDRSRVGLLGAEHHGQCPVAETGPLQSVPYGLAQSAMVSVPQIGKTHLRDVGLRTGPHAADHRYPAAQSLHNQSTLGSNRVDGIYHKIKRAAVQQSAGPVLVEELCPNRQTQRRMNIQETTLQHPHLFFPYRRMQGTQLPVDVAGLHAIGIHQRHLSDTGTHQHLCRISTNAAQSDHQHMRSAQTLHPVLPQQQQSAFLPVLLHAYFSSLALPFDSQFLYHSLTAS